MATKSVAQRTTREERGLALFRERGEEIQHYRGTVWSVPSCSGAGVYLVEITSGVCTCPDTPPEDEVCKHATAALIAHAKTTSCAGCGGRFPRRELVEVHEDGHDGMMHDAGERVCGACASRAGVLA